jgi:hypothetical protein
MTKLQTSRKFSLGGLKLAAMDAGLTYAVDAPTCLHKRIRIWRHKDDAVWDHKALIICSMLHHKYLPLGGCVKNWKLCYVLLPGDRRCHDSHCSWDAVWSALRNMAPDRQVVAAAVVEYEI